VGSERYTPYAPAKQPAELLTIANHILGTGQLSLAKFLFIAADGHRRLSARPVQAFLEYIWERIDLTRDVHFYTKTTIDTLDYSGTGLNTGSKVVLAVYGDVKRQLATEPPSVCNGISLISRPLLAMPGVLCVQASRFSTYARANEEMDALNAALLPQLEQLQGIALIVVCDDSGFAAANISNFVWTTFTRCNPSHDIYGIGSFTENKHWGCRGPLVIDARIKPHHAPVLEKDPSVEKKIDRLFAEGGSLQGIC
jgi:4-hydroxy-3-polyprenylbenzoate decarboxylase